MPAGAGSDRQHHIVTRVLRHTPQRQYVEWLCSCPGFWFSATDTCRHIKTIQDQLEKLGVEVREVDRESVKS